MLGEPVLGEVNPFLADGSGQAPHGHKESVVLVDVLVQLLLGVGGGLSQEVSLLDEVVLVALEARGEKSFVSWVLLHLSEAAEQDLSRT